LLNNLKNKKPIRLRHNLTTVIHHRLWAKVPQIRRIKIR
jgi:hypothetical protein